MGQKMLEPHRPEGYYWVRVHDGWEVDNWDGEAWWVTGTEIAFQDHQLDEIGERLIPLTDG